MPPELATKVRAAIRTVEPPRRLTGRLAGNMLPDLGHRLDRLHRQRVELLAGLESLTPLQLGFRPTPDSWNSLDVVEHLVRVEERILGGLATRPGPRPLGERMQAAARLALLYLYLQTGGRVKAPAQAILPAGGATLGELRGRWNAVRAGLAEALERFEPADLARPMMRHPIVGKLSPVQTLRFLHRHIAHHRRQIRRIRMTPGFPV
jgi:hypothetical protein